MGDLHLILHQHVARPPASITFSFVGAADQLMKPPPALTSYILCRPKEKQKDAQGASQHQYKKTASFQAAALGQCDVGISVDGAGRLGES